MKIRTSLRAGGSGCSPETQAYMQKALNMQNKVENCMNKNTYVQPQTGYYPPVSGNVTSSSYVGSGYTYPDMSGACG